MKILLINAPAYRLAGLSKKGYPIGLGHIAAALAEAGYDRTAIYDVDQEVPEYGLNYLDQRANFDAFLRVLRDDNDPIWRDIERTIRAQEPDLVGISAMSIQYAPALRVARIAKRVSPSTPVVMGGVHPTLFPHLPLSCDEVDYVVQGEGQHSFLELIRRIETGRVPSDVPGVWYRENGAIRSTPEAPVMDTGSQLPAREALLQLPNYSAEDLGLIMSSVGCPFQCTYCQNIYGRKVRYRDIENVVDEIEMLVHKHDVKHISFKDECFTISRKRCKEFGDALARRKLRVTYTVTTRCDLIDAELLSILKRSGCVGISVGIESGSDRILEYMKKKITVADIKRAVRFLNRSGLFWSAYFIVGLPMETAEEMEQTYDLMKWAKPHYLGASVYAPYPKTEMFSYLERLGIVDANVDNEHFFTRNRLDYYYVDPKRRVENYEYSEFIRLTERIIQGAEVLNKRPSALARRVLSRRQLYTHNPRQVVVDARKLANWVLPSRKR